MKLATLIDGTRDGKLAVVSRDLTRALPVPQIARRRSRRRHRRCADASFARGGAEAHQTRHAGQRREPARLDPGRTREAVWLLAVKAGPGFLAGRGHAR